MVISLAYNLIVAVRLLDIFISMLHLPVGYGIAFILKENISKKLPVIVDLNNKCVIVILLRKLHVIIHFLHGSTSICI